MQSATDMYDCTHGPKKDCHACLVRELVAALERAKILIWDYAHVFSPEERFGIMDGHSQVCTALRNAKALYVGPAEVPPDHGHPHDGCEECGGTGSFWKKGPGGRLSGSRTLCSHCLGTGVQP